MCLEFAHDLTGFKPLVNRYYLFSAKIHSFSHPNNNFLVTKIHLLMPNKHVNPATIVEIKSTLPLAVLRAPVHWQNPGTKTLLPIRACLCHGTNPSWTCSAANPHIQYKPCCTYPLTPWYNPRPIPCMPPRTNYL